MKTLKIFKLSLSVLPLFVIVELETTGMERTEIIIR